MLIDEDAVVDCDARLGGEADARLHADTDDDEVALQLAPIAGADTLNGLVALERLDAGSHQHLRAVVGMDVAVDGAHLGPEHPLERDREGIQDGDLEAALTGGSGYLGADPAGSDHNHRATTVQPFAQGVRVLDAAQVQDAVELASWDRETARLRPRG